MQNKFSFFFQALIIYHRYTFTHALFGHYIRNATKGEYPAVVCLADLNPNRTTQENIFCTGVFITQSHALSSQHCFDHIGNKNFRVIAEHPNVLEAIEYFPLWWITYDRWARINTIQVPIYFHNDVAMLRIKGSASESMRPSIISKITPLSKLFEQQVQIAGFGKTNTHVRAQILQTTNVYVIPNKQCETFMHLSTEERLPVYERYLCTAARPYALLGKGDSGGPLYYHGILVALNRATMPQKLPPEHPSKVNIHIGLEKYDNFISAHLNC